MDAHHLVGPHGLEPPTEREALSDAECKAIARTVRGQNAAFPLDETMVQAGYRAGRAHVDAMARELLELRGSFPAKEHEPLYAAPAPLAGETHMTEREAFEAWARDYYAGLNHKGYFPTQAWDAYRAGRAHGGEAWRNAVIDGLVCAFIYRAEHDNDPRKALHDLICWEVQVALDPRVSKSAAENVVLAARHVERELTQYVEEVCPADATSRGLRDILRTALAAPAPLAGEDK